MYKYTAAIIWLNLTICTPLNSHQTGHSTSARLSKRFIEKASHEQSERLIICLCDVAAIIESSEPETDGTGRFHNTRVGPAHRGRTDTDTDTGAEKEAKFGITMSLLNFRLRPSIKNHLRQHWIDRCSPWHLCDITVLFITNRWHT